MNIDERLSSSTTFQTSNAHTQVKPLGHFVDLNF